VLYFVVVKKHTFPDGHKGACGFYGQVREAEEKTERRCRF